MNGMTTVNTFIIKLRDGYALSKCFSFLLFCNVVSYMHFFLLD